MKIFAACYILFVSLSGFSQYHSEVEIEYVKEVNLVRINPKAYAAYVRDYLKSRFISPEEIRVADSELIPILDTLLPMQPLVPSDLIRQSLKKFNGKMDSSKFELGHGDFKWANFHNQKMAENLGSGENIRASVIFLLIDAVAKNRGHRQAILERKYNATAVRRVCLGNEETINHRVWWIQEFVEF